MSVSGKNDFKIARGPVPGTGKIQSLWTKSNLRALLSLLVALRLSEVARDHTLEIIIVLSTSNNILDAEKFVG